MPCSASASSRANPKCRCIRIGRACSTSPHARQVLTFPCHWRLRHSSPACRCNADRDLISWSLSQVSASRTGRMQRLEFIGSLGCVLAWPAVARSQPSEKIARIGWITAQQATSLMPFSTAAGYNRHEQRVAPHLISIQHVTGTQTGSSSMREWSKIGHRAYPKWDSRAPPNVG